MYILATLVSWCFINDVYISLHIQLWLLVIFNCVKTRLSFIIITPKKTVNALSQRREKPRSLGSHNEPIMEKGTGLLLVPGDSLNTESLLWKLFFKRNHSWDASTSFHLSSEQGRWILFGNGKSTKCPLNTMYSK